MRTITFFGKSLALVLPIIMIFGMMPIKAFAENNTPLLLGMSGESGGNAVTIDISNQEMSTISTALGQVADGGVVTVTGETSDPPNLRLNIPAGKTVVWQARSSGSSNIVLLGSGAIEISAGGKVESTYGAIQVEGNNTVTVNGEVTSTVNGYTIVLVGSGCSLIVGTGGVVSNTYDGGVAVGLFATGSSIIVDGGTVTAKYNAAIDTSSGEVIVNRGTVQSANSDATIVFSGSATGAFSGGTVTNTAVATNAVSVGETSTVLVSGGEIVAGGIKKRSTASTSVGYYIGSENAEKFATSGTDLFTLNTDLFPLDVVESVNANGEVHNGSESTHYDVVAQLSDKLELSDATVTVSAGSPAINRADRTVTFMQNTNGTINPTITVSGARVTATNIDVPTFTTAEFGVNIKKVLGGAVGVSGTAAVGNTLTVDSSELTPAADDGRPALEYKWQSSANGSTDWTDISGATGADYIIPVDYSNKYLRAVVIAAADSGATGNVISSSVQVQKASIQGSVSIHTGNEDGGTAGVLEAGDVLTVDLSGILPASAQTGITYEWSGGNGSPTNQPTYIVTQGDENTQATITLTVTAPDYTGSLQDAVTAGRASVTIGGITTANKTYDGTAYAPNGTVTVTGGAVPVNQLEWLYESADGAGYSSTSAPMDAGAYWLTISVPDSNANFVGSEAFTFTIEKRQITLTADHKAVIKGGSLPELTYTVTNLASGESKTDALSVDPTLACPTFDGNTPSEYPINITGGTATDNYTIAARTGGILTVAEQTYAVTFNLNGGTRTGGGALTQTVAEGSPATAPTVTRSGYTFTGWDNAFTNVTSDLTVTAGWSYNGGGGTSGGDDGGYTPPATTTTTPGKTPDQPVTAVAPVTATAGTDGAASASIPEKSVTDAIAKAQADAKAQGKTANGIGVELNVTMPKDSTSLTAILTRSSLNSLVSAGVTSLEINGSPVTISFDKKALAEIQKQSTGNVTIGIAPKTNLSDSAKATIGARPLYDITVNYVKDGKTTTISDFGGGIATLSIPYTPGKNEAAGYLYGVYVDAKGNATRIEGSVYDANARAVLIPTGHLSIYGVGYTAPSAKFTDIGTHWGKESIDYAVGRGLLSGTSETTFAPDTAMTRGMLVTALGRLAGVDTKLYTTSSFTDVKADSVFSPYIEWAYKKGIVQGIGNSQFAPDRAVTREEIAVIFTNYAKATGYTLPVTREATTYADASSIGSVYKTAVTAMHQAGIMIGGSGNKFNPKSSATRAEVSSMLHRYIKLTIDPATAQGWTKNDAGQWLYYKDGKALTGWQTIDGVMYTFYSTGALQTGWVKDDAGNWHFYSGNVRLTGWWDIGANGNNKRYYFTLGGIMASGKWLQIDGKWYYFYADGSLARSTKIGEYEVDENGVRKTE